MNNTQYTHFISRKISFFRRKNPWIMYKFNGSTCAFSFTFYSSITYYFITFVVKIQLISPILMRYYPKYCFTIHFLIRKKWLLYNLKLNTKWSIRKNFHIFQFFFFQRKPALWIEAFVKALRRHHQKLRSINV